MTAQHCGINSGNAGSLVVYWNYENSWCRPPGSPESGGAGDGTLSDFQSGSFFRTSNSSSDFTLVELDDDPNPDHNVGFAGWDATGADAQWAVGIHHPNTDEKRISFEYDPTTTTSYLGNSVPGNGTHVRVTDWDLGTTEPGSSGSPLFNQDHRAIGQLHGGYASCTSQTSDWYGKFSYSWTHGLSSWLDPGNTGLLVTDTISGYGPPADLGVSPSGGFESEGASGGPFTPPSATYTLTNNAEIPITYLVTKTAGWLDLSNAGGTISVGGQVDVIVSINSSANALPNGHYDDVLNFYNTTNGDGDTTRPVSLDVGVPVPIYAFDLSTDPGWSRTGSWAWGTPTGGGGEYGNPDPTSGYTGPNVYGYNLSGDYTNNMSEQYLTTTAIDCSNLTQVQLKFRRWLNVETATYDHAYVRVSNDGSSWTTSWQNPSGSGNHVTDSSWGLQSYDISSVADDQATVYVRWVIGTTDSSWRFSGWNIDDVEIWGVEPSDTDCNGNGTPDDEDIATGTSQDCNSNLVPDECDISDGTSEDCNTNLAPDECDLTSGTSEDCNSNTIPDECDIPGGTSEDCNTNTIPDECDINDGTSEDCNTNLTPDECDLAAETSEDCNTNTVPDECDVSAGTSEDCQPNGIPDECDISSGISTDLNGNDVPDECELLACKTDPEYLSYHTCLDPGGTPPYNIDCRVWTCDGGNMCSALVASGLSPDGTFVLFADINDDGAITPSDTACLQMWAATTGNIPAGFSACDKGGAGGPVVEFEYMDFAPCQDPKNPNGRGDGVLTPMEISYVQFVSAGNAAAIGDCYYCGGNE
jgi:hypothetical protein